MAKQMVQKYRATGNDKEADKLQQKIDTFNAELKMRRKEYMRKQFDFENPTQEMIEEAKAKGIDLSDKATLEYLKALRNEKIRDMNAGSRNGKDGEESSAAQRSERANSAQERRNRYGEAGRDERRRHTGLFGSNRYDSEY